MRIDLGTIAQRISAAAERCQGYTVLATHTELIISKDGFGTGRSESVAYPSLFLQDRDMIGEALDRLERGFPQAA